MEEQPKSIAVDLSPAELRYLISCGVALAQNVPPESLPTYCGFTLEEIAEFSDRIRSVLDSNGLDM